MQKTWTSQALIVSAILNTILVALLFFIMLKEYPTHLSLSFRPSIIQHITPPLDLSSYEILKNKSYQELVALLEDRTKLRAGYRVCDVALGILYTEHDLDIQKALGCPVRQKYFFQNAVVFDRLSSRSLKKIGLFIRKNRYPFTPYGLYRRFPDTAEAFFYTQEYNIIRSLMRRLHPAFCSSSTLLSLCQQTPWFILENLYRQQQQRSELTEKRALCFLIDAMYTGSRTAAYLLVIHSPQHNLEEYDHATVMHILSLLDVKTQETVLCCQNLMHSQRPEMVIDKARAFLAKKS